MQFLHFENVLFVHFRNLYGTCTVLVRVLHWLQFVTVSLPLQQLLYLVIDVLGGEAEFFVEDLVRSGETEGVESPDGTVFAHEGFECARQAGCHTEAFDAFRQDGVLVVFRLLAKETFGRYADDLQTDTLCAKQFGTGEQG